MGIAWRWSLSSASFAGERPSILVFTKEELQSYLQKGWERRFQKKLRSVIEDDQ
jgi:hypothetical protein